MIRIGLTGGIGSGKSTVSQLFQNKNIPVFNSDNSAREAEKEQKVINIYKQVLGNDIYVDGELDRAKMRAILFTDKDKLKQVSVVVTEFVKASFELFVEKHVDRPMVMLESAILFENNHTKNFDYIIAVTASENTRIKRVMNRDKITVEEVLNKMKNQLPEIEKIEKSDFVIINECTDMTEGLIILDKQVTTIIRAISSDEIIKSLEAINEAMK
jgi:dephospho-CoA kinase